MHDDKTDKPIEYKEKAPEAADKQQALDSTVHDQKFANTSYTLLKHGGVNYLANSALSLGITYNVMPTETAQKGVAKFAGLLKPVVETYGKIKESVGFGKFTASEKSIYNSARSTAEIICMCIAGTLLLVPMRWMDIHKKEIVDKIDRWKNPEYYKNNAGAQSASPAESKDHEKEEIDGTKKLLGARAIGVGSVIAIDAGIQGYNNSQVAKGKPNLDTYEWKLGSKLYDKLPTSITEKIVNFFSRRKTSDLSGIQPEMKERLRQTVGNDTRRMIFAEQSRFVCKEGLLTGVLALLMYPLVETGVMSNMMKKIGIKKSNDQKQVIDDILPDLPFVPITKGQSNSRTDYAENPQKKFTDGIRPVSEERTPKPQESYVKRASESAISPAPLGV